MVENTKCLLIASLGFENAYWIVRLADWAIQHVFLKLSLVNLISKDADSGISIYKLTSWFTLQTSQYDLIIDVC